MLQFSAKFTNDRFGALRLQDRWHHRRSGMGRSLVWRPHFGQNKHVAVPQLGMELKAICRNEA